MEHASKQNTTVHSAKYVHSLSPTTMHNRSILFSYSYSHQASHAQSPLKHPPLPDMNSNAYRKESEEESEA